MCYLNPQLCPNQKMPLSALDVDYENKKNGLSDTVKAVL